VTGLISLLPRRLGDRVRWAGAVVFLALAVALPPLAGLNELVNPDSSARFTIFLGTGMLVLALWAISYNLMLGYAGLVSFAHAAYYGIGAYTVAIFYTKTHGASLLLGLALAPLVTVVFGFVTGLVALRAVRLYFSLLTLAISQLLFAIASQWYDVTGGDNGLHGLTVPDALTDYTTMYYFVAAVVLVCLLLMFVIVRSPFGAALAAIRENRERAASVGINVKAYELAVFTVAALFAGVAGGLYAFYQQEAFPQMLFWTSNADPVIVALLGGIQSFLGPALGAVVLTMLRSYISKSYAQYVDIVLGAIVLALVLLAPGGLVSLPELFVKLRNRFRRGDQDAGVVESEGEAFRMLDVQKAVEANAIQAEEVDRGSVLLKLEGLTKRFGGLRAVEEVNLEVRQGDRHAIIGPNGAGKSTLFNLSAGASSRPRGGSGSTAATSPASRSTRSPRRASGALSRSPRSFPS
jgi:branched-chain amino acid transport system permease protein